MQNENFWQSTKGKTIGGSIAAVSVLLVYLIFAWFAGLFLLKQKLF